MTLNLSFTFWFFFFLSLQLQLTNIKIISRHVNTRSDLGTVKNWYIWKEISIQNAFTLCKMTLEKKNKAFKLLFNQAKEAYEKSSHWKVSRHRIRSKLNKTENFSVYKHSMKFWLRFEWILAVFWMNFGCIFAVFWLYFDWTILGVLKNHLKKIKIAIKPSEAWVWKIFLRGDDWKLAVIAILEVKLLENWCKFS